MTMIRTSANENQCLKQDISSASGLVPHNLLPTRKNFFQTSSLSLLLILLLQDCWSPANRLLLSTGTIMCLFKGEKLVYFSISIHQLGWTWFKRWWWCALLVVSQFLDAVQRVDVINHLRLPPNTNSSLCSIFQSLLFQVPTLCALNQKESRRVDSSVNPQLVNSSLSRSDWPLAFRHMVSYLGYSWMCWIFRDLGCWAAWFGVQIGSLCYVCIYFWFSS